jgi:uncharacterized membrane protein
MKKPLHFFISSSLCLIFFSSCTNASEEDLIEPFEEVETVTYTENVKAIIDNNCIFCHNNPPVNGAPNPLITFQQVREAVENRDLIGLINSNDPSERMPLGGQPLTQQQIEIIEQWEIDGLLE